MLGDVFGGQFNLFPAGAAIGAAAPCSLSAIMHFCWHHSSSQPHWEQVGLMLYRLLHPVFYMCSQRDRHGLPDVCHPALVLTPCQRAALEQFSFDILSISTQLVFFTYLIQAALAQ